MLPSRTAACGGRSADVAADVCPTCGVTYRNRRIWSRSLSRTGAEAPRAGTVETRFFIAALPVPNSLFKTTLRLTGDVLGTIIRLEPAKPAVEIGPEPGRSLHCLIVTGDPFWRRAARPSLFRK